jgi:hypothetical protein
MFIKIEAGFQNKIKLILDKQKLKAENLDDIFKRLSHRLRNKEYIPPTVHINCRFTRTNQQHHLRVLIWADSRWRKKRIDCIVHQQRIYNLIKNKNISFSVPRIILHGKNPLVWELSEYIDGHQLPWKNLTQNNLKEYIKYVDIFVKVNRDLQRLKSKGISRRNWTDFCKHYVSLVREAHEREIIGLTRRKECIKFGRNFLDKEIENNPLVLTHGDYNPINIIFANDNHRPYLLDWDHLRYSIPGDSFARLWMFVGNEPFWQSCLLKEIRKMFQQKEIWNGFKVFVIYESLKQCQHEFKVAGDNIKTWSQLKKCAPKRSRMIFWYRKALYDLVSNY